MPGLRIVSLFLSLLVYLYIRHQISNSWYANMVYLLSVIERSRHPTPPIYTTPMPTPTSSRLRTFMSLPSSTLLILGPRRVPPVPCPTPSSATSLTIMSSDGYRQLATEAYIDAIRRLRPDIVVGMADLVTGRDPGVKRREKMVDRTHAWTGDAVKKLYGSSSETTAVAEKSGEVEKGAVDSLYFAPILPLDASRQQLYTRDLATEYAQHISGFAIYDSDTVDAIPASLSSLPRLALTNPRTPQEILRSIVQGVDILTAPFANAASDAGIALAFTFPASISGPENEVEVKESEKMPLAVDMWPAYHAADMSPLTKNCGCYACTTFSRAYIRHLLNAKEMLAWSLLQIHNMRVLDDFFAGVRSSIEQGNFDKDVEVFERVYQSEMPVQTGQGPRLRGYQFKTEKGDGKKNEKVYGRLDDAVKKFGGEEESKAEGEIGVN